MKKMTEQELFCYMAKYFIEWDALPSKHEMVLIALQNGIAKRTSNDSTFIVLDKEEEKK